MELGSLEERRLGRHSQENGVPAFTTINMSAMCRRRSSRLACRARLRLYSCVLYYRSQCYAIVASLWADEDRSALRWHDVLVCQRHILLDT